MKIAATRPGKVRKVSRACMSETLHVDPITTGQSIHIPSAPETF
jgi:hypothetical protein